MSVTAVIGGQYGSEGKGVLVAHLAQRYRYHVRVGGPNAGHSFYHQGRLWKMQSVPCGWINPQAILVIGRGALVSTEQLLFELAEIETYGDPRIQGRVWIDAEAAIIDPVRHAEGHTEGELHRRIGSTGEGIGAARVARMARDPDLLDRYGDWSAGGPFDRMSAPNTSSMLNAAIQRGEAVLLEGTQGAGLSLLHGPWPYVTSADCGVAALASEVGIAPRHIDRTLMVLRTFPIRVAGNSGPLYGEMTWEQMSARLGRPVEERTTVTKKVRRIGDFDEHQVRGAIERNAPTHLALTFADYLSPEDEGKTEYDDLSEKTRVFIDYLEREFRTPVAFVGTGGEGFRVIERADRWQ